MMSFERLGAALLFLGIAVAACFSPAQNDTWWHLRAGQDIWTRGAIDLTDHYSHTVNGAYWPNHEWLSQVLMFGAYWLGGLPLLTALAAALIVATWSLIWYLTPGGPLFRVVLCAVALIPSSTGWALRPQVLTLFLLSVAGLLLARRQYLWLPPLFLVWANLHAGVMLGFALLAGGALASMVEERKLPWGLCASGAGCIVASMVTPLGPSLWTEVPATLARTRPYGIMEWRAPGLEPLFAPFWMAATALVTLIGAVKPWREGMTRSRATIGAAVALLPLALSSGRNVPPFMLFAVPAIAVLWTSRTPETPRVSRRREHPRLNAALLAMAIAGSVGAVGYAWTTELPRLGWHPLPKPAITALASCPEPLYNRYDEGGFLIWFLHGRQVFVDSRQDPYPADLIHAQIYAETSGDYRQLFDRYAIQCALVSADSPIARRLSADGWHAVYSDYLWRVFVRPPSAYLLNRRIWFRMFWNAGATSASV